MESSKKSGRKFTKQVQAHNENCWCSNAALVAARLNAHAAVRSVRYPGLEDDPAYAVAGRQMSSPGFLIGATFADAQSAKCFIEASGVFIATTSFGGLHSSADRRSRWGDEVPEGFLRLSIGCEPTEQLVECVNRGLSAITV